MKNLKNFLDYDSSVKKTFIVGGIVINYQEEYKEFIVQVYHDDYRSFKVSDYGEIVFSTLEEAKALLDKLKASDK